MCRVKTNFTNWTTTVTSSATKISIVHFPLNCQRRTVSCSLRAQVFEILFQRHSLHLFQILFSGIVTFTPTALDKRLYNSTGEYTVCEETVRWGSSLTIELLTIYLFQVQLLQGEPEADKGVWREVQGGVWWSEASPGAGRSERRWERLPQRVPGLPVLLPQDDPLQDSLEGQEQREVLQAGWHW